MDEYKSITQYDTIFENITKFVFSKIIGPPNHSLIMQQNDTSSEKITQNLISEIESAYLSSNEENLKSAFINLCQYFRSGNFCSFPMILNIIPICIDQLNRKENSDEIKIKSIECLCHVIIHFKVETIFDDDMISKLISHLLSIISGPIDFISEFAISIVFNLLYQKAELTPEFINIFTPQLLITLLQSSKNEKGFERLIAHKTRVSTIPLIIKLFLMYSIIELTEENFQIIIGFFDSFLSISIQSDDIEKEKSFYSILHGLVGVTLLFHAHRLHKNEFIQSYFRDKSHIIFPNILSALEFFRTRNNFDMLSIFLDVANGLLILSDDCNDINFEIAKFIIESIPNTNHSIKVHSFNFLNTLFRKSHFSIEIDQLLIQIFRSIEEDSFEVENAAFSTLITLIHSSAINQLELFLNENVFQALAKMYQSGLSSVLGDVMDSILILHHNSENKQCVEVFNELFLQNEVLFDVDTDSNIPQQLFDAYTNLLNSYK